MSLAAKIHHTSIIIGDRKPRKYKVPADKVKAIVFLLSDYRDEGEEIQTVDESFKEHYTKTNEEETHLRGFRLRDNLTQVQLAQKAGISQSAIAAMETGKRPISKVMAKKLATLFDTDHRAFL